MKVFNYKRLIVAAGFAVAGLTGFTSVSAAGLEEVVVTAQKREQSLQDVGISVSAFSGNQLKQLGITNTVDITQQVPNMQLFTWSPAYTVFSLRGVSQNNFQDNLEAPIAVYMDGAYVANMSALNAQLFDMERVEVLRGPQGTLYGRNTTGGLIHYISNKPDEEAFNGYIQSSIGSYKTTGLESYSVEGAAGGALTDKLRARVAGRWQQDDGYLEPGSALGAPVATGGKSQGADGYALRGIVQYDFTPQVMGELILSHSEDNTVPTGQYIVSPASYDQPTGFATFTGTGGLGPASPTPITGSPWKHFSNEDPFLDREVTSATGTLKADLGNGMELTSITNYMIMDKYYIEDAGGGLVFFPYNVTDDFDQFSQELRLSGETDRMRWQVGAYYLDMTWDTFQSVTGAAIHGPPATDNAITETFGKIDAKNWSLFGEMEYDLNSQWTLIAGLRYSDDDKNLDMTRYFTDSGQGIPRTQTFDIANVATQGLDTINYGDFAVRAQVNWHPKTDTLIYASFNRGIKGGNWSLDPLGQVATSNLKHGEEILNAYEIGIKTSVLNGLGRFNAAAFYYDYNDYQAFSLTNLVPQVTNSDAREYGGELEFTVSPTDGLDFVFGAAFLDSKVDAVPTVFAGSGIPGTVDSVETEFPNAPSVSLNWMGRYEWPVQMLNGNLAVQVDGNWNDDQYLEGTNSAASHEGSYAVWNARLSYMSNDGHWEASVWTKNFTNEAYRMYNLDLGLLGFVEQMYAPPRQVGGTVSYSW